MKDLSDLQTHVGRDHLLESLVNDLETIPTPAPEAAEDALLDAPPAPGTLPPFTWADDVMDEVLPDPAELIHGILHQGSKLVLGGSSKSFKTWALLDMAISVATGSDWLGFPTSKTKVLYLNLEIQSRFMQKRIAWVRDAKGHERTPGLAIWNLRGHAADIARLAPQIIAQALREGFGLIIIDPIYKVGGDRVENSAEGVADLVNHLERIAVQTGAAIVFGAHFSKGNQAGKEAMDRISGSGVFARDPDAILVFTAHEEAGAFTVEPTLRNFAPCEPFVLRWQWPLFTRDGGLDPAKLKRPKTGRESIYAVSDILDVLGTDELKASEWLKKTKEETMPPMSDATFYGLVKKAAVQKKASKSKITGTWSAL